MRAILIPIGSSGDVFPFLAIGRKLRQRGHEVVVITSGYFRETVERQGFRFREFGSAEQFRRIMADPSLWHPLRGLKTVMAAMRDQAGLMRVIESELTPQTVVVAHSLAFAARVLQEKRGVLVVSIALQPSIFRSVEEGPCFLPGGRPTTALPRALQDAFWWFTDRVMVDPHVAPAVDPLRASLGLPRVRRFFRKWIFSPQLTIAMFPPWFAQPQLDWPPRVHLAGFPLTDDFGGQTAPELEELLRSGERPIVFTAGSANVHARGFFEAAVEACHRLDRWGVLLTRHREQVPRELPPHVLHLGFAPLSALLPQCAAIVHHGGIGTTAAGLAAGVPQLLSPLSHDQPDNAARVVRLGVGARLMPRRFTGARVAVALSTLLESGQVKARCGEMAAKSAGQDGAAMAAGMIEEAVWPLQQR